MINSFKNYLVEEEKTVYFTFGRMNPPTIGHESLLKKLSEKHHNEDRPKEEVYYTLIELLYPYIKFEIP